jgi:23S rRNA (guanosine2251-2'-O)-methyltransferase
LRGLCSRKPFPVNQKSGKVRGHKTAPEQRHHLSQPYHPRPTLSKEPFKKPWRGKASGDQPGRPRFDKSRPRHQGRPPHRDSGSAKDGPLRLFGMHAVEAALRNPMRKIKRLALTENAERRLIESMGPLGHPVELTTPRDLDRILGADAVHQGAMLETEELPEPEFVELAENANGRPLLVLDQVTDPHNVGAILRSAAVFGAAGLVMTRRHSPPLNGVLAKSASGALELVPVALVQNLSQALNELKDAGFTVIGLDGTADGCIEATDWTSRPIALVLGAEGKGLRELTQKNCDVLARITTDGALASLNVSNAAAVALHTAALARLKR